MKTVITERHREAVRRAARTLDQLRVRGVDAKVVGSLAERKFGPASDVDFLVIRCPTELKYRIEWIVEDEMGDIPFDLVYREEVRDSILLRMERYATDDLNRLIR